MTGDGGTGGVRRTAAQLAADRLPRSQGAIGREGRYSGEQLFSLVLGLGTFAVMVVAIVWLTLATFDGGWWMLLAGLPAWLVVRYSFARVRGGESGTFAVDRDGTIRVLGGHGGVRRLVRLFDAGTRDHLLPGVVVGMLVGVGLPFGLAGLCVWLDDPRPAVVFLTTAAWAMADLLRWFCLVSWVRRRDDLVLLDGHQLLPLMALYARHHGWRAAVSGVPADRLATTLAEHPAELEVARQHAVVATALAAAAGTAGGAAGLSQT